MLSAERAKVVRSFQTVYFRFSIIIIFLGARKAVFSTDPIYEFYINFSLFYACN